MNPAARALLFCTMCPVKLKIRRAEPKDARAIRDVHVASIRGLCAKAYSRTQIRAWSAGRTPERYRKPILEGKEDILVGEAGGRIAGFVALDRARVHILYVHPRFAGKGVGHALMRRVETLARRRGLKRLTLDSTLNAVPFYERGGFKRIRRDSHVVNRVRIACVRMTKPLR